MRIRTSAALVIVLSLGTAALAQNAAPRETASTTIQGKKVAVEYGRPALKGRSFDDLTKQLPPDRMWRAGSEQITSLSTDTDILIGGKKVPAGKYSLYVHCPESGSYSLVLNSVLGQPLGKIWDKAPANLAKEPWPHFNYSKEIADKEVARVPMKKVSGAAADMLTIAFKPSGNSSVMTISWGDRAWSVDVAAAK